ncbi:DgyrCDS9020 [Dimorphilus gyrociliatus]|uniref:DgyrCDS9020 n=1 Tax=Dimorphilus gyrociliatus TaxID=2664684 RepID=A0A7I8VVV3_9ANNE|nr:DgyrCDS9020 [Dimorphilus gyrociliatus]
MINDEGLSNVSLSSDTETELERSTIDNAKESADQLKKHDMSNFGFDQETNADEEEEKQRLISQVLELQNTLDDLSQRVDAVKEENLKLKSENQVLGQYIENLMKASAVFQSTSQSAKKK